MAYGIEDVKAALEREGTVEMDNLNEVALRQVSAYLTELDYESEEANDELDDLIDTLYDFARYTLDG